MAKPTVLPEFATQDLVDPTSTKNNVVEPSQSFKDYGWHPFRVRPIRNVMNWLHRHTYLWLKYIDDELEPTVTSLVNNMALVTGTTPTYNPPFVDIINVPAPDSSWDNKNTHILSIKVFVGVGTQEETEWYGLNWNNTLTGYHYRADFDTSAFFQIPMGSNGALISNKPYQCVLQKIAAP